MDKNTDIITDITKKSPFYAGYSNTHRQQYIHEEFYELTSANLAKMAIRDNSRYYFYFIEHPAIFTFRDDLQSLFTVWARLFSSYSTAITGFQDITMEKVEPTYRSEFVNAGQPARQSGATKSLTWAFPSELSGSIMGRVVNVWMDAMRDKYSQVAHANGYDGSADVGSYSATGFILKPNPNLTKVEYCAIVYCMFPLNNPYSQHDADWKQTDVQELSLEMNVSLLDNASSKSVSELGDRVIKYLRSDIIADTTLFGITKGTVVEAAKNDNFYRDKPKFSDVGKLSPSYSGGGTGSLFG